MIKLEIKFISNKADLCLFFAALPDDDPEHLGRALATYALYVQKETSQKKEWIESQTPDTKPIQLNLWCFDSSKAVHAILRDGARNVIFTSGILFSNCIF